MEEISTDPGWGGGFYDVSRIGTGFGFQKDRNVGIFYETPKIFILSHLISVIVSNLHDLKPSPFLC